MGTSSAAVSVDKNFRSLIPRCVLSGTSTARELNTRNPVICRHSRCAICGRYVLLASSNGHFKLCVSAEDDECAQDDESSADLQACSPLGSSENPRNKARRFTEISPYALPMSCAVCARYEAKLR